MLHQLPFLDFLGDFWLATIKTEGGHLCRFPPPRFERSQFVDHDGRAVEFEDGDQPSLNRSQWKFTVSPHTDPEGWQYSTSFSNIDHPRDGGRASKRATDCVRCREWVEADNVRRHMHFKCFQELI